MDKEKKAYKNGLCKEKPNWSTAITWLNLVLSILIVFLHVDLNATNSAYVVLKRIVNVFADCAVPAFFWVSAYLAFRNYSFEKYIAVLLRKIKTILLPYIVWSALGIVYQECLSLLTTKTLITFSLYDLLFCKFNEPLWFLRVLFGYIIASPIICFVVKRKPLAIIVMLGIILCNIFVYTVPYASMLFWLPIYLFGAFCGANYKDVLESEKPAHLKGKQAARIVAALLLVLAIGLGMVCYDKDVYYLYRIISGVLIICCFFLTSWNCTAPSSLQNSFFTFCAHALLLGLKKVFLYIFDNNTVSLICGYIICVGVVWGGTVFVAELLKKCFPKIHAILVGGRKNIGV